MGTIDFGQVAKSYARAREDIPVSLMDSLYIRGISFDGKKVADIGCGTGAFTRKLAMRKAEIVGIDPSRDLLQQAKELNRLKNYQIPYVEGTAESTRLEDSEMDIVTVMRAWHWFDRPKTLEEINRILKPGGSLIIIDSGFLTQSTFVQETLEILSHYVEGGLKPAGAKAESKQRINGFPIEWFQEWRTAGFELRDFYKLTYQVSFTPNQWIERIESTSWLAGMNEATRTIVLQELTDHHQVQESVTIPHECNVCILKLN